MQEKPGSTLACGFLRMVPIFLIVVLDFSLPDLPSIFLIALSEAHLKDVLNLSRPVGQLDFSGWTLQLLLLRDLCSHGAISDRRETWFLLALDQRFRGLPSDEAMFFIASIDNDWTMSNDWTIARVTAL